MKRCFTICYSEKEANEVGHFILSRGYEGVQNDSYRYCRDAIRFAFTNANRHHRYCIYVGCNGGKMIVSHSKRILRKNGLKYIEKKRMFYELLEFTEWLKKINSL